MSPPRPFFALALAATLVGGATLSAASQDPAARDPVQRPADETPADTAQDQVVEGVITQCDPPPDESAGDGPRSLTIHTAAVWRDYVRDTATEEGTTPEKAAEKGKESVATKGQPQDENTTERVEIGPDFAMELRYRDETDDQTIGGPTPESARKIAEETDPADPQAPDPTSQKGKPFDRSKLKPGLFVRVHYRQVGDARAVTRLIVLEPIRDTEGRK